MKRRVGKMAELENEGPESMSVVFCPDDPQPVSQEQPATILAAPVSADPPLKTMLTSLPTSAPDLAGEIPANVMENVAKLTWPNEKAPGGVSIVYLVGTAHVSKVRIVGCGKSGKSGKRGERGKTGKRGKSGDNVEISNCGLERIMCE